MSSTSTNSGNNVTTSKKSVVYHLKKIGSSLFRKLCVVDNAIINIFNTDEYGPEDGQYMGFNQYPHNRSKNRPRSERELQRLNSIGLRSKGSYKSGRVVPTGKKSV
jgi:hypothetical protein